MTLHEAIEIILQESRSTMTSRQIADTINERKLYSRKDGKPVSASQITARVGNYEKIFVKENGSFKLVKDDVVSAKSQEYRGKIAHIATQSPLLTKRKRINLLIEALEELENDEDFKLNDSYLSEPTAQYGKILENPRSKLKVAYKLCNWFFDQENHAQRVLSDQLASIISGLNWFSKAYNIIKVDFDGSHSFLLKIASENASGMFKIHTGEQLELSHRIEKRDDVNLRITNLVNNSNASDSLSLNRLTTKIIIPSFGIKTNSEVPMEFESIISEIDKSFSTLDRAILIVPSSVLAFNSQRYISARRKIVLSKTLNSVISFPNGMMEKTAINLSLLVFNFKERNGEVFFHDVHENNSDNIEQVLRIINNRIEIKDVSKRLLINDLNNVSFDLTSKVYTFNPLGIDLKRGYEKYLIKKLIDAEKSGRRFKDKNSLYPGGEYKLIRTSDIERGSVYFQQKDSMLGIDHDELDDMKQQLVSGGIVISGFNKLIKVSILSTEETYAIGQDVHWIKVNPSLVIEEYLINELYKPYVSKQVQFYSKGTTISRLSRRDFLNIQVQLPPVEVQKEILFADLRKHESTSQSQNVSSNELDFIKTLKHSLKQPVSGIGNDFSSLRAFLNKKNDSGESLTINETIVPIFDTDTPEQIEIHTLSNTLDRMGRAISDIDYILDQAMLIITAAASPKKENIELRQFLSHFKSENPKISIIVLGSKMEILADRKQLRILINNFLDNAKRHGFLGHWESPTVWMEIRAKDALSVQISIRNNGRPLPSEFTIEDFLAKGASTKQDVGSGFGGFLIGQIIKNHKGSVELVKSGLYSILPHNVEFVLTLPK